ncbi:MAG: hypothetical protein GX434_07990 [Peptococcaceae bacterium]|nr:hypothetical protein [Peptococcaceae bacterium]
MFHWISFPQLERRLRSNGYKLFYNAPDEEIINAEHCPTCNINLKYIGYKNNFSYKAYMYCDSCSYWEQY